MHHSVHGAGDITKALQLENGDDPFAWGDDEMHNAASAALLVLRNKETLPDTDFAQLCWLERSLHEQVSFCVGPHLDEEHERRQLSRYSHLINDQQLQLVRQEDELLEQDGTFDNNDDDTIVSVEKLFPEDKLLKMRDDGLGRIFSDAFKEESNLKRDRVLDYLTNIF